MTKLVKIGNLTFSSKSAVSKYIVSILSKYGIDSDINQIDSHFVKDLLAIHPQCDAIVGTGIDRIIVHHRPLLGNNKHFYVYNIDGKLSLLNWKACIDNLNAEPSLFYSFRKTVSNPIRLYEPSPWQH